MHRSLLALLLVTPVTAFADVVVANVTLRAKSVIAEDAVRIDTADITGAASTLEEVIGQEVLTSVFAGRPIMRANLREAAMIERNQMVRLVFSLHGLTIETDARATERGAVGDTIRVINTASKKTVFATVLDDGRLQVTR